MKLKRKEKFVLGWEFVSLCALFSWTVWICWDLRAEPLTIFCSPHCGLAETLSHNVFVFCCCIMNYHKLCGWKQYALVISQFPWPGVQAWLTRLISSGSHKATIKELVEPRSPLETCLGRNLLPGSFRLCAGSISLWLYGWGSQLPTSYWPEAALTS